MAQQMEVRDGLSIELKRNLNDWEISEFADLLHVLSGMHLSGESDQLVWKFSKFGIFSVRNLYEKLMGETESIGIFVPV